jgi:hypothetical protein
MDECWLVFHARDAKLKEGWSATRPFMVEVTDPGIVSALIPATVINRQSPIPALRLAQWAACTWLGRKAATSSFCVEETITLTNRLVSRNSDRQVKAIKSGSVLNVVSLSGSFSVKPSIAFQLPKCLKGRLQGRRPANTVFGF